MVRHRFLGLYPLDFPLCLHDAGIRVAAKPFQRLEFVVRDASIRVSGRQEDFPALEKEVCVCVSTFPARGSHLPAWPVGHTGPVRACGAWSLGSLGGHCC